MENDWLGWYRVQREAEQRVRREFGEETNMASIGEPWNERQYIAEIRCGAHLGTFRTLVVADSEAAARDVAVYEEDVICGLGQVHTCEAIHKRQPDEPYWEQ